MTMANFPTCREAWLVCIVDKYCCLLETFHIYNYNFHKKIDYYEELYSLDEQKKIGLARRAKLFLWRTIAMRYM